MTSELYQIIGGIALVALGALFYKLGEPEVGGVVALGGLAFATNGTKQQVQKKRAEKQDKGGV